MDLKYEHNQLLRDCGVRITPTIKGVRYSTGSGVLYVTQNTVNYDYVITAKHNLQESSRADYDFNSISRIEISCPVGKLFKPLCELTKQRIADDIIVFTEDLVIIKIEKSHKYRFPPILVSDNPKKTNKNSIYGERLEQTWNKFILLRQREMILQKNDINYQKNLTQMN